MLDSNIKKLKSKNVNLCLVISLLFIATFNSPTKILAQSAKNMDKSPVEFTADEVTHDDKLNITKASGNVEISRNSHMLLADLISYNQRKDIVSASGNISLIEPNGDVIFADWMEISGDFKSAIIKDLRMRRSDNARIAANSARRTEGNRTEMLNAVYSPCNGCASMPDQPLLWQIKAKKIIHDKSKQQLEYYDSWMEIAGIPVVYTPYFTHPDPTVKRRSGFLTPKTGGSTYLGQTISTPYYHTFSPSNDLTITPTITTKERLHIAGEYRQQFTKGNLESLGSITYNSQNKLRGHIDSTARFDINKQWRWGFDANKASDDTYLRLYKSKSLSTLTSKAFVEGFSRRNYLAVHAYDFQGTSIEDDPKQSPLILPMVEYSYMSDIGTSGGRSSFDASSVVITRSRGTDMRRISASGSWQVPHIGTIGDVKNFTTSIKGDLYHIANSTQKSDGTTHNGFASRIHPELKADWRLPLARQHGSVSQVIEPLATFIAGPNKGNTSKIPNEDSLDFEFDDTNLFSQNKFTGHDRIEGGSRINYGLKWGLIGSGGGYTSIFAGQTYQLREARTFAVGSGLDNKLSDFVGRINMSPGEHFDLHYRTRLDKDNFSPLRNEVQILVGPPALRLSANYIFFEPQADVEFSGREEISGNISTKINRFWQTGITGRYDMLKDGGLRNLALQLNYDCECFQFTTTLTRQFYEDRDLQPNDTILFKLTFKTLGEVQSSINNLGG